MLVSVMISKWSGPWLVSCRNQVMVRGLGMRPTGESPTNCPPKAVTTLGQLFLHMEIIVTRQHCKDSKYFYVAKKKT